MPGRDGGVRRVATLGSPARSARARDPADSGEESACVRGHATAEADTQLVADISLQRTKV